MITLLLPRKNETKQAKTYQVKCDHCHTSQFTSAGTINRDGVITEAYVRGWTTTAQHQFCPKCVSTHGVGRQRAVPSSPERIQAETKRVVTDLKAMLRDNDHDHPSIDQ